MAKFIVLYGTNNIGKTTQCKKIVKYLKDKGLKARYFKTPNYKLPSGKKINKILRSKKQTISERELQKLYSINRFEQQLIILKELKNDVNVVMEDYVGTSFTWGGIKGLTIDYLKKINKGLLKEDIAILLDGKRFVSGKEKVHLHEVDDFLMGKARQKHLELAKEYKWHVVNANQSKNKVFEDITSLINHYHF